MQSARRPKQILLDSLPTYSLRLGRTVPNTRRAQGDNPYV